MAIHPKDKLSQNPRLQCDVCGKWKRLHTRSKQPPHDTEQTFFGGCDVTGDDHNAAGKSQDVCAKCCPVACKPAIATLQPAVATMKEGE